MSECLFSAPFHFLSAEVIDGFRALMPTTYEEVWQVDDLTPSTVYSAWVINPGQDFIVDGEVLSRMSGLKVLITPSTGSNHIDVETCKDRGVTVLTLLDDREVLDTIAASAEFTFLLLLNVLRRLDLAAREVAEGRWRQREDYLRGKELQGRSVGLVGFGRIGGRLARYCSAFGAYPVYCDPYVEEGAVPKRTLEAIFSECDAICLCCALTKETSGMITYELLRRLKPNAALINTSRGEVLVEEDLVRLLHERDDVLVGLDVLSGEARGVQLQSPLVELHRKGRIVITPHVAGATVESQSKAAHAALRLLRRQVGGVENR